MVRPTSATAREAPEETAGPAEPAVVLAGGVAVGSGTFTLIARPAGSAAATAVETVETAAALALQARAGLLDIGRDWEALGLELVTACQRASGLPVVCAVSQPGEVAAVAAVAGMLRVPAAALSGGPLARALGRAGRPVLLEGDPGGVRAWLRAAERIAAEGNDQVVLCASGGWAPPAADGRTPAADGRTPAADGGTPAADGRTPAAGGAWLDLAAVPSLRLASGLPLVIDASRAERGHHNAAALARAAAAVCADGVVVVVDPRPGAAGGQPAGLAADELDGLASELEAVAAAVGRRMAGRRIRYVGAGRRDSAGPARRWRRP